MRAVILDPQTRQQRYFSMIEFQRRELEAFIINDLDTNVSASDFREKAFSLFLLYNRIKHKNYSKDNKYAPFDFALIEEDSLLELKSRKVGKKFGDVPFYSVEHSKLIKYRQKLSLPNNYKHFIVIYEFCHNGKYEYYASKIDPQRDYETFYLTNQYNGKRQKKFKIPISDYVKLDMLNLKDDIKNILS